MESASETQEREVRRGSLTGDDFDENTLENVEIIGSLDESDQYDQRLRKIKNSVIRGDYGTKSWRAPGGTLIDSRIEGGDIQGSLLTGSQRAIAIGESVEVQDVLSRAEDSLLMGDNMKLTGDEIGILSEGSVIAARNMQVGQTTLDQIKGFITGNFASTPEEIRAPLIAGNELNLSQAGKFEGEWNELSDYLQREVPKGSFRPFDLFNLPDHIEDVEHLDEVVGKAKPRYDEVNEKAQNLEHRIENVGLEPLQGGVEELYNRIKGISFELDEGDSFKVTSISDPGVDGVNYTIVRGHQRHDDIEHRKYLGNIEELTSVLNTENLGEDFLEGRAIASLGDIESFEELEYEVEAREIIGSELKDELEFVRRYGDEIDIEVPEDARESYRVLKKIKDEYDLDRAREGAELLKKLNRTALTGQSPGPSIDVEGSLEEKYQQLANLEDEMKEELRREWNLSDEAMEAIDEGNTHYLIKNVSRVADDGEVGKAKKLLGLDGVNQFLTEYKGGNPEKVLEPDFEQTYFLDGENAVDEQEDAVNANYEKGITLLERLSRDQGNFEVTNPEIQEMNEELEETIEQISNSDGRPPQNLIQKKNQLRSQIEEKKREEAFEDLGIEYGDNVDFSDLSPLEVRQTLDQLSQEYLESCKAEKEAKEIASHIDVSGDVGNGYVKFEMYDKDITNMPDDDRAVPCSFPGGSMEHEFLGYIQDKGTQIGMLESGDDTGAVISHPVQHEGEDYLLIHSVESDDGITSRQDVSEAVRKHIVDYAEEAGMDGVIYSTSSHNSAAEDFIENAVEGDENYTERTFKVDKEGDKDVYLDFELPEVEGYKNRM